MDVELFTCGGGPNKGNSMCPLFHSNLDDAFKYSRTGASFYGNPEYTVDFITKTLPKVVSEFSKDPNSTSCLCFPIGKRPVVLAVGSVPGSKDLYD